MKIIALSGIFIVLGLLYYNESRAQFLDVQPETTIHISETQIIPSIADRFPVGTRFFGITYNVQKYDSRFEYCKYKE